MGEAVGGLTARMGFFALEPDSPRPAPQVQNWGCTKETLSALEGGGAAVWEGGLEKGVRGDTQPKRVAGLWWRSHAELASWLWAVPPGRAGAWVPVQQTSGHSYPQPVPRSPPPHLTSP